jgi:peptide methionine sulfoxide reductase msrA/msrB
MPWVGPVRAGYANGKDGTIPAYETLKQTGHAETVEVVYREDAVALKTLVRRFFQIIDPLSVNRQGHDAGTQYRTGVFYVEGGPEETALERKVLGSVFGEVKKKLGMPELAVVLEPLRNWFPAEEYHQDYLGKNPGGYCHIPVKTIRQRWPLIDKERYPRPGPAELRRGLTPLEFEVVENGATEGAGTGDLEGNFEQGLYVDRATGEPLFLSAQKYHSGCGWPAFSRPIDEGVLEEREDPSIPGRPRVEVRSSSGSHLGHVFNDGPVPGGKGGVDSSADPDHRPVPPAGEHGLPKDPTGLRYCVNSAALRFVPLREMEREGYGYLTGLVQ